MRHELPAIPLLRFDVRVGATFSDDYVVPVLVLSDPVTLVL